jgi:hypothetical protein
VQGHVVCTVSGSGDGFAGLADCLQTSMTHPGGGAGHGQGQPPHVEGRHDGAALEQVRVVAHLRAPGVTQPASGARTCAAAALALPKKPRAVHATTNQPPQCSSTPHYNVTARKPENRLAQLREAGGDARGSCPAAAVPS